MRIVDGSCSKVAAIGTVVLSRDLVLQSVLFVPSLYNNLLYMSKLPKDLDCVTKFSTKNYVFQDSGSGKTIGNDEHCAGLYLLTDEDSPKGEVCIKVCAVQSISLLVSLSLCLFNKDGADVALSSRPPKFYES